MSACCQQAVLTREISDRSLDLLILRVRPKVEIDPAHPRLIRTVRGSGCLFDSNITLEARGLFKAETSAPSH
ncbi:hypothetical protein E0H93_12860 [Rhizobium leguminosarum bv. viciae]|nr:hypothetical protein [Rhizobium leguminosarum bv. viciae]TBY34525.1 hypothetical protein E0H55_15555 [Rhizobium leguminosarum bv. viciae]TBY42367.1 hypothetical protein E0H60_03055 [Rhizobium leguminosarum bv. viciae]TBZ08745.1 hypothetical protein E0H38_27855 [Rhizobium leguminosarum bv. viciae]TCA52891.1 hypothetical protein E0H71_16650 [Rhizobium leguminosarum bv. viciae]